MKETLMTEEEQERVIDRFQKVWERNIGKGSQRVTPGDALAILFVAMNDSELEQLYAAPISE